jgi:hypothetical protein
MTFRNPSLATLAVASMLLTGAAIAQTPPAPATDHDAW